MKQYEFIVTYFDSSSCKEKCDRFEDSRSALNYISTLSANTVGNLHCFGHNIDCSYIFCLDEDNFYIKLLENVIEFLSYDLGGFN